MCIALDNARWQSTSRWWKPGAQQRLLGDFGTSLTQQEANKAFEAHVRDFSKVVQKSKGDYGDFMFALIAESPEGPVYFHFTFDEDPDDPQIVIESAHKPDYPTLR